MRAQFGQTNLQGRGDPECGPRLAQGSIHPGEDSATLSHQVAAFATSFRHSVVACEARYTRRGGHGSIGDCR